MATQALLNRARILRLATASIAAAPTDGTTAEHFKMSPRTPTALRTTGLALGLKAPTAGATAATAIAAGFSVVVWILNPVTKAWFAGSGASISYDQAFSSFDFNASSVYFQVLAASVSVAGSIDFHAWEQ